MYSYPTRLRGLDTLTSGLFGLLVSAAPVCAQAPQAAPAAQAASPASQQAPALALPALVGRTLDGRGFTLSASADRVRVVVLWRTDCLVCLGGMAELRANALGWKDKPFDLLLVSLDPRRGEASEYDNTRRLLASSAGPVISTWHGDLTLPEAWRNLGRMPVTLVFDRQGRLAHRHAGRMPAELWDEVAELLP